MGKPKDSRRADLGLLFRHAQGKLHANLLSSEAYEHPTASGSVIERYWTAVLNSYLPARYRASNAFIIDSDGNRSRQIDLAVYDRFNSPILFQDAAGPHIPAEAVCAVFEIKHTLISKWIAD